MTETTGHGGHHPRVLPVSRFPAQPLPVDRLAAPVGALMPAESVGGPELVVLPGFSRPGARFAPIDHVVVAPAGVFVVVAAQGDVELVDDSLRRGGRDCTGMLDGVVDAAAAVAELLPRCDPAHVTPVLGLSGGAVAEAQVGQVLVCALAEVARVVRGRPRVIDGAQVGFLGRRLTVQQQPVAGVSSPRPRRGLRGLLARR